MVMSHNLWLKTYEVDIYYKSTLNDSRVIWLKKKKNQIQYFGRIFILFQIDLQNVEYFYIHFIFLIINYYLFFISHDVFQYFIDAIILITARVIFLTT